MRRTTKASIILQCGMLLALGVAGCAPNQPPAANTSPDRQVDGMIACESPRPEICTRDYRPVCASRDTGVRCVTTPCESTEWHTYGNACSACADPKVYGYHPGECPAGGQAETR